MCVDVTSSLQSCTSYHVQQQNHFSSKKSMPPNNHAHEPGLHVLTRGHMCICYTMRALHLPKPLD